MTWYSLRLAHGARHLAEETWQLLWGHAESVHEERGAALFRRRDSEGMSIFFTPSARKLALAFGAQPCPRPRAEEVKLVAGDEGAWAMHFRRAGGEGAAADAPGRAWAMKWWVPQAS